MDNNDYREVHKAYLAHSIRTINMPVHPTGAYDTGGHGRGASPSRQQRQQEANAQSMALWKKLNARANHLQAMANDIKGTGSTGDYAAFIRQLHSLMNDLDSYMQMHDYKATNAANVKSTLSRLEKEVMAKVQTKTPTKKNEIGRFRNAAGGPGWSQAVARPDPNLKYNKR